MEIITEKREGVFTILLKGELDASNCLELDTAIQSALDKSEKKIQIDCSGLDYISSAGLGVFISYLNEFGNRGVDFSLFRLKEKVLQTFRILGLDKLVNIV